MKNPTALEEISSSILKLLEEMCSRFTGVDVIVYVGDKIDAELDIPVYDNTPIKKSEFEIGVNNISFTIRFEDYAPALFVSIPYGYLLNFRKRLQGLLQWAKANDVASCPAFTEIKLHVNRFDKIKFTKTTSHDLPLDYRTMKEN